MRSVKLLIILVAAILLLCSCSDASTASVFDESRHAAALNDFWGELSNAPVTDKNEFLFYYSEQLNGIVITDYKGDSEVVCIPETIDGQPVKKVDLRYCYKNIGSLILPDSLNDVRLAKYDDILAHYNDDNFTHDWFLSYYYVEELGGCVVNDYYGTDATVRIPEELPDPDRRSTKWKVKKIELNNCEKEIGLLIVPDSVKYVYAEPYSDRLVTSGELHTIIDKSIMRLDGIYSGVGVERMNIPASLFQDRRITFANSTLTDVFIPGSITELSDALFMECPLLERAVITADTVTVGNHTFFGCIMLKDVDISKAISIGDWAFGECVSIETVRLNDSLTYIGNGAFHSCGGLVDMQLPASVKYIGERAFGEYDISQDVDS